MSSAYPPLPCDTKASENLKFRYFMMLLACAIACSATATTSLSAGETVFVTDHWTSHLVNHQTTTNDPSYLPAPAENLDPPPEPPTIITDKHSQVPNLKDASPRQPACFVAAPMSTLTVDVSLPTGRLPQNVAADCAATTIPKGDSRLQSNWATTQHHWSATCQAHQPLYFEEINAERYGYTPSYSLQPLISAGHFFLTIPILPYKLAVDCPRECSYTLGHYRPGSCVPRRHNRLPRQGSAALVQTAAIAGLILLIP